MLSGKRSAWKLLPHTLRYFISMDSYFDKQLHQVELTLYAQNNGVFLSNGLKMHSGFKLVCPTICDK